MYLAMVLKGPDADLSPTFDSLNGIQDQVHKNLVELSWRKINRLQIGVVLDYGNLILYPGLQQHQCALNALVEVGYLELGLVQAGVVLQAVDDFAYPLHAAAYYLIGVGNNFKNPSDGSVLCGFGVLSS
jgi:hypothetical protein